MMTMTLTMTMIWWPSSFFSYLTQMDDMAWDFFPYHLHLGYQIVSPTNWIEHNNLKRVCSATVYTMMHPRFCITALMWLRLKLTSLMHRTLYSLPSFWTERNHNTTNVMLENVYDQRTFISQNIFNSIRNTLTTHVINKYETAINKHNIFNPIQVHYQSFFLN